MKSFCISLLNSKRCWLLAVGMVVLAALHEPVHAGPFFYRHEFTQPTGVKFWGTYQGDEYESRFMTESGYTFVCKGPRAGGPYEYALLDGNGDFTGSGLLVGIDTPPEESYQLDRAGAARVAIDHEIMKFENSLDDLPYWRDLTEAACAANTVLNINVGIILIEFNDRPHIPGWEGQPYFSRWIGQTTENVETMMNSIGVYYGYQPTVPPEPGYDENRHPSMGQWACGSFREYWRTASYGLWDTPCTILNPRDANGEAIWMVMNNGQHSYSDFSLNNEAITRARQLGWGVDDYDNIIILYPGIITIDPDDHWYGGHGNAGTNPPSTAWPLWEPGPMWVPEDGRFMQIGTMTHEWGHVIGWPDLRGGALSSLMSQGNGGGPSPESWGASPTGLGAFCERGIGFYTCFAGDATGGIIHLDQDQFVSAPARTEDGHWVYSFGGTAANPTYLIDARWVEYDDIGCGEIDNRIIQPYMDIPENTNYTQLVLWDVAACAHPGTYCVVRNPKSSLTYMFPTASDGSLNFWHVWPGSAEHSPNTVDWTPFTFPNTGTTGSALTGILPSDAARTVNFTFHMNYPQDGTLTIDEPVYAFKEYRFTDNVEVISPGVFNSRTSYWSSRDGGGLRQTIKFSQGKGMTIQPGGIIRGVPNLSNSSSATWTWLNTGQRWGGINILSDDATNSLAPTISGASTGIRVLEGHLRLDRALLTNNDIGFVWLNATGQMLNSSSNANQRYGGYIIGGNPLLEKNTIRDNQYSGLKVWHANNAVLRENTIDGNGIGHSQNAYPWSGILLIDGSVTLKCNHVYENEDAGLVLAGMSFANMGRSFGMNLFENNGQAFPAHLTWDPGQVSTYGGTPYIACGVNTFRDSQNLRWLIRSPYPDWPEPGWDYTRNYWGTTDVQNILQRLSGVPEIEPIQTGVWNCANPNNLLCPSHDDELLFFAGWEQEREGLFADAIVSYETLLAQFPGTPYKSTAMARLSVCKKAVNWDWQQIRDYFLVMAADSSKDSSFVVLCRSNAAWCLAEMNDYDGALSELDSLLDHTSVSYMQLYLVLKSLLVELEQDGYELLDGYGPHNGSRNERGRQGTTDAASSFDAQFDEIDMRVNSALAAISRVGGDAPPVTAYVPREYLLYQNYPNPFNPTTEIRFDLPEASGVKLQIFNTLGQVVATLVDERRAAGHYNVFWDASDIASGLYVYRIEANGFVDSKKMVLIR